MQDEVDEHNGHYTISVFLDCSKCYDRVQHDELDSRASALGFPDLLLVLCLDMYSAPKHTRVSGAISEGEVCTSSNPAGCGSSAAASRK